MQPPGTFSFAQALIAFVIHTAVVPLRIEKGARR